MTHRLPDWQHPIVALGTAARHAPGDGATLERLAQALAGVGDIAAARDAYAAALVADPTRLNARWLVNRLLPRVYTTPADLAPARTRFAMAVASLEATTHPQTPAEAEAPLQALLQRTNFELAYQGEDDRALQEIWGRLVTRVMAARFPDLARPAPSPLPRLPRLDGRLRIGFASSCFHAHTIALLFNGWIRHLDREKFIPHVYVIGGKRDVSTETLLAMAEVGRDLRASSLEEAARTLRADALDVLVYPDLGMDARGVALAGLRLAPVQCVSWGHPVTTGLPTIDWFLSAEAMEPEGAQAQYSERLFCLPRLSIAYAPARALPGKDRAGLGLPEGVLYLCSQALQKYLPQHDAVLAAIARTVPEARFVFIRHQTQHVANQHFQARLVQAFRQGGAAPDQQLVFLPWLPWNDYLALNAVCDVFLDSMGWSGGNTTLEALSRGLPPVTLPSRFMRGRHTFAMLSLLGLPELIAQTPRQYVEIAVRLGLESAWRTALRDTILQRRGRIFHDLGAVRALEAFFLSHGRIGGDAP